MSPIPQPEVYVEGQQSPAGTPGGVERGRLRATAAALTSLMALAATSLVAGPAVAKNSAGPCALPRTSAHHSLGLDTWNAGYPRPASRLDAVMVFLSFPDSVPNHDPGELATDHFPATSTFFDRASYGRFKLRADPQPAWVVMPKASTAYGISRDWEPKKRSAYMRDAIAAADPTVDFSRYDIVYLVADPDAPGVDSDATKVVNFEHPLSADGVDIRRVVTVFERHPPDRNVLAHETGHVFDLPDLYHRPVDGKGDWDTYVGDWDVMGSQFGMAPDLFGWHKWKLGWLDERAVRCVTREELITLEPIAAAPAPRRRPRHPARGRTDGSGHGARHRGTRRHRQRRVDLHRGGAALPRPVGHGLGRRSRRGHRHPSEQRGVLGPVGVPGAGGRAAAGRRDVHDAGDAGGADPGGGRGPYARGRLHGQDHHRIEGAPRAYEKAPRSREGPFPSVRRQGLEPRTR